MFGGLQQLELNHARVGEGQRWAFIVGAPRCGTTSLSRYLRGHPDVCFSRVKEPHFFSRQDLRSLPTAQLREVVHEQYLDRFFPECETASLRAEGSVTYFYVPERLEPVLRLWPQAKFIISLRSPLQMIPSLHQRNFFNGDETERHFERAWSLVPQRRHGRALPRRCADPRWLDYWEIGRLGKYLAKFLSTVGRERCFISIYDDFATDPAAQYRRVLEFLGLPDDQRTVFKRHRESSSCRIAWLQRWLKRPPKAAISLVGSPAYRLHRTENSGAPHALSETALALRKQILKWNRVPADHAQVAPRLLGEMRAMYRNDIALLSDLVGRDLQQWLDT